MHHRNQREQLGAVCVLSEYFSLSLSFHHILHSICQMQEAEP